ncbi:MAG: cupin domain-containing protein, partial [Alistipes sp.]|nr:cupin domain-containing protein [Alistipes sp.]
MTENIGYKLKRLREDSNLSMEDLAAQSGVQLSQIELIEKGQISPSLAMLVKLSRSLGIRLGTFLDGMESPEPTVNVRTQQTPQLAVHLSRAGSPDNEHLKYRALAENKTDRNMEPFMINVEYVDPADKSALSHHEGEEFIYVLEGDAILHYGEETYEIHRGDSIYFDSI